MPLSINTGADGSDPQGAMLGKLKHAFKTYDEASKKYLSAVKDLDTAMEGVAVAFRELAQGDIEESAREQANSLCSAIDSHKSGTSSASRGDYYFSNYMSDFAQQVTHVFAEFKESVKAAEKSKDKRDESVKKYQKLRAEVDETETKLAKKNQGIAENPKYAEKVTKRDAAKAVADSENDAFSKEYKELMAKRAKTLKTIVTAMSRLSSRYYESLANVMKGDA